MGGLLLFLFLLVGLGIEFERAAGELAWFALSGCVAGAVVMWSRSHDERT